MSDISHDSETPAIGQQVITAVAFIYATIDGVDKVFMPKRAKTKKFLPDVYELPGGHIDFGEDLEVGLAREIMEEFGKTVVIEELFGAFAYTNDIKGSHSVELIYLAQFSDNSQEIALDPEDHSEYRWVSEIEFSSVFSELKGSDDPEFVYAKKGFEILKSGE